MTTEQVQSRVLPLRALPGGSKPSSAEGQVAILIAGGALILYSLRKGMKGIGPVQLTGSGISGVEFAAYLVVVGGIIRTAQATWPDNPIVKATAFVY
jgi:hypothetical protein